MRLPLHLHPDCSANSVEAIEVEASRPAVGTLRLSYRLKGRIGDLLVPGRAEPERTDALWRRTCFEAFLREDGREAYVELNLSPSRQWAAYRFETHRCGMSQLALPPPKIEVRQDGGRLTLDADVDGLPHGAWHLGLSAVIEERDRSISYWALAHPPGRPDFHHRDCFRAELPPPMAE
jgi:hypothetical protein